MDLRKPKVSWSPKEVIAKAANLLTLTAAMAAGVDPAVAPVLATFAEATVKSASIKWADDKPHEQLRAVVAKAIQDALNASGYKFSDECQIRIVGELFSEGHALQYAQSADAERALRDALREIILKEDCDADVFAMPIERIAHRIALNLEEGVKGNPVLLALWDHELLVLTNSGVRAIHEDTQMILHKMERQAQAPGVPPEKWLTKPSGSPEAEYIDRPEDDELLELLNRHDKVFISGMGGLGKTSLMRKAGKRLVSAYRHAAWISYVGSLSSSFVSQFTFEEIQGKQEAEALEIITKKLNRMGQDLILFVDNVDKKKADDPSLELLQRLECKVVVTTRTSVFLSGFAEQPIGILGLPEARALFRRYAGELPSGSDDDKALDGIVELAGWHTLALEIIAKAAKKRKLPLRVVREELVSHDFGIATAVATAHSGDCEEKMMEQLEKLYSLSSVADDPAKLYILKNFAVLPYLPLSREDVIAFLGLDEAQEQQLYELADLGWLELSDEGFAMHPIVRQVARRAEIALVDCETLVEAVSDVACSDFFSGRKWFPYLASIAEFFRTANELAHPLLGKVDNNLSTIYWDMAKLPEALDWQLKAKGIAEALYSDGAHPNLATTYNNLSIFYLAMGNLPEALKWQLMAKEISEALYPDGAHRALATTYNNLSTIYQAMGKLAEALEWQIKAKGIMEALHPDGAHPDLAMTYNNLSTIYQTSGNLSEALDWQLKAKGIREELFTDCAHPDLATTYNNLSTIYLTMGNLPEALDWQLKAKSIIEGLFPDCVHPNLAMTYNNLSMVYQDMGNLPEALKWLLKAKEITEELYLDGAHRDFAAAYNNLSMIYLDMGKLSEALKYQLKTIKIMEALYPNDTHPDLVIAYSNLSLIYQDMGNLPEAQAWQQKANRLISDL